MLHHGLLSRVLRSRAQAQQKDPAAAFDAYTTQAFKDWGAVGLAVAVVKDGKVVFAKGYGVQELGKPAAVDTNTRFSIGSTTKAMTAAALGMLVDEGKVRWDDPVTKYLPWFQLYDPYVTREITVRDLLTHRAGLGGADMLWYQSDNTPEDVLRLIRYAKPAYSFRSGWIYQNVMYATAGAVVAAASGMPWEEFIRTRIFTPLDMRGSVPTLAGTKGQANVASPHDKVKGTVQVIENASVDQVNAAGSIWSSVADMSKWMRFMIDSGRVNGKALLKPGTWNELLTPVYVMPAGFYPSAELTKPKFNTYALGWFQHDYAGRRLNYHTGSIDGMVAIIGIIPGGTLRGLRAGESRPRRDPARPALQGDRHLAWNGDPRLEHRPPRHLRPHAGPGRQRAGPHGSAANQGHQAVAAARAVRRHLRGFTLRQGRGDVRKRRAPAPHELEDGGRHGTLAVRHLPGDLGRGLAGKPSGDIRAGR